MRYQFRNRLTGELKEITCNPSEIKETTKLYDKRGYDRVYNSALIGFDNLGRSKKKERR